jgi:signal transduction histidine kinase
MRLLLPLLLLVFSAAAAQNKALSFEEKRKRIERFANAQPDSVFIEATALLNEAKKSGTKAQLAKAQSTMALVKVYLSAIEDAKALNEKSLAFHQKTGDAAELAKNHFNLGVISERQSDYIGSIQNLLKAISYAKKSKDYVLIQKSYRGLAMSSLDQQNMDKALEYCQKSLEYQRFKKDGNQKAYALAAMGEVYRMKGDLPKANQYFQFAFDQFGAAHDEFGQAWVLTNWSLCHDLVKMTEMALEAQKIWNYAGPENTMSIMNLGNIGYNFMLIACNDSLVKTIRHPLIPKNAPSLLAEGEKYLRRSLAIAKKKKNRNAMVHHGANLSGVLYMRENFKSAYDELNKSFILYDSLYSQENKNKIAALESEKKLLVRDEKIRLDKLTLANKEKQKWYLIGGLVLLGVIGLLLFNQSRNRRKTNEKLTSLNEDLDRKNASLDQANKVNARFFGILNHDLRRPVYNLIHFLQLQKESPDILDEKTKKTIEAQNITSAENLLKSMEDLLLWSKSQMENFRPKPENVSVQSVFDDVARHFSGEQTVTIRYENPKDLLLFTDRNYLATVVRNLTGNAVTALSATPDPLIVWRAARADGKIELSITDNGPGMAKDQYRALYDETEVVGIKTGLGLHLIRDLANAIGCVITVESAPGKGSVFTLTFS